MKILFLSAQYPPETKGGGELSTHLIAQGLVQIGHTVHVLTDLPAGRQEALREDRIVDGIPVTVVPMGLRRKPLFERRQSKRAAKLIRKAIPHIEEYDIIHAHDFRSALALQELDLKNAIVTARDYAQISGCTNNIQYNGNIVDGCQGSAEFWNCHRVHEASLARKLFRVWQYKYNVAYRQKAFASYRHQIFISHAQKDVINKYQNISHQHTTVIYNPIAQEYLSSPLEKGEDGKVLYIGRVEMYKGVLVLLKAWRTIADKYQQAHLTIAGDGAQREEYERLVSTWGLQYRVTFIPYTSYHRLQNMINESEILVAPHLWVEPFGRTVIEGMARGKVVIASNVGGPAEIIAHNKTGLLFDRGSVSDLTHTIEHALTMNYFDKKEIGIAARDYVRDSLNMEKIAKQHEEFYQHIT